MLIHGMRMLKMFGLTLIVVKISFLLKTMVVGMSKDAL